MNLIDTSFWFEFYSASKCSRHVEDIIKNMDKIIVPTIIIVEMFKKLISVADEDKAFKFIAQMKKGKIVDLDFDLSLDAASFGKEYNLPIADSIGLSGIISILSKN